MEVKRHSQGVMLQGNTLDRNVNSEPVSEKRKIPDTAGNQTLVVQLLARWHHRHEC
jgi:hypothetical protein